jgi:hypothetical protein
MPNITFTNAQHKTTITLKHVSRRTTIQGKAAFEIGHTSLRRMKAELCGVPHCGCVLNDGQSKYSILITEVPNLPPSKSKIYIVVNE